MAIGAPWILPTHTGSRTLAIIQSLPVSMISHTDSLAGLINNHIGPAIGISLGLAFKTISKLIPPSPTRNLNPDAEVVLDAEFEDRLWPHIIKRIYDEGVKGISSDALLFMKKGRMHWDGWEDYDLGVCKLGENMSGWTSKLRVDVFYAETDYLIGKESHKGPQWFNQCWKLARPGRDAFDFQSWTIGGTDHNSIWDLKWGAIQIVFGRINEVLQD
jgi:hypothetical protein